MGRVVALLVLAACAHPPVSPEVTNAIQRGTEWVRRQQAADGSFGKSPGVAALVAWAIGPNDRLKAYLKSEGDGVMGRLPGGGFDFPNYTTALVILAGFGSKENSEYLRSAQLVEGLDYKPAQQQYGGWDFGVPERTGKWMRCDLSVTTFVIDAIGGNDKALIYVERCRDPDTGGFFFCPWGSKAGYRQLPDGSYRPRAYGSMTCDGIRAMLACGVSPGDARIRLAREWLAKNMTVERNPGFADATEEHRIYADATLYYYYQTLARTLEADSPWREKLAKAIVSRQRADGSWINQHGNEYSREQEPLIATCFALVALRKLAE